MVRTVVPQATGVAPTDDGFTVIKPGAEDVDRDGASFVGDPAMGFAPLRRHVGSAVETTSALLRPARPPRAQAPALCTRTLHPPMHLHSSHAC